MNKFKKGDRVRVKSFHIVDAVGTVRRVISIGGGKPNYDVSWDDSSWNYYYEESLELVNDMIFNIDELFGDIEL